MMYLKKSFIFLLSVFLLLTGCATAAVDQFIHHPMSSLSDEFTEANKQLSCIYSGLETIDGHSYARIEILPNSDDCQERPTQELLLPMENSYNPKATFRSLGKAINDNSSIKDKTVVQPVNFIFYNPSSDRRKSIEEDMKLLLPNDNWSGYPSTVIVGYKFGYADTFAYRITSRSGDILVSSLDSASVYHNIWMCKSKENNIAGIILKPFAVVFDIITSPIQLIIAVLVLSK